LKGQSLFRKIISPSPLKEKRIKGVRLIRIIIKEGLDYED